MEHSEFKEFEIWRDYFGLAELMQSGKFRDEHESVSIYPNEQTEKIQPGKLEVKEKKRRGEEVQIENVSLDVEQHKAETMKRKLCFAPVPYHRPRCAY